MLGVASIPFEPGSAAARYVAGAASRIPEVAEGRALDWSPEAVLTNYEERVPIPLKFVTELAAPVPPIGKLGKFAGWAKKLENKPAAKLA
ncbi:MAG: hypothetical protein ACYC66_10415, partial [Chloroflexota bacterium]